MKGTLSGSVFPEYYFRHKINFCLMTFIGWNFLGRFREPFGQWNRGGERRGLQQWLISSDWHTPNSSHIHIGKLYELFRENIPTKKSYFPLSVCFHTSIVAISNSLNIKFESALFQFHWERRSEGGIEGLEAVFLLLAILVACGCGRSISDYNLISDHYKVTTGTGLLVAEWGCWLWVVTAHARLLRGHWISQ